MSDASPTTSAVEFSRVSRLYGTFPALREVSLSVEAGSSVMLLGENGAGKSTLLRLVAGLAAPSFGSVSVFGSTPHEARDRIAYMSHASMLYDELTGLENLRYFASLHQAPGSVFPTLNPAEALREVGLDPDLPRRVGNYSQGMRQRASLARVLLTDPDLLLLDEPFSNLDTASAGSMIDRLRTFLATPSRSGQPRTLLLTTHQAELARPLANLTLTMRAGRIVSSEPSH